MPLEYIYTYAPRTHSGRDGIGIVFCPNPEYGLFAFGDKEKDAKAITYIDTVTGVDDWSLKDPPFYAFTKYNQTCSLTRTFITPHYQANQPPVPFAHTMFLDSKERAYLSEGPVYAIRHLEFQTRDSHDWPRYQESFQQFPSKIPQPLTQSGTCEANTGNKDWCETWEAITGDKGWCGWCVEQILEGKTLFWVYDPKKTDGSERILDLLEELFQLTPAERRWSVTFNTRVDLPGQITHQILCVEEGKKSIVPKAQSNIKELGRDSVRMDLHQLSQENCPDTDWTNYARNGNMVITCIEMPTNYSKEEYIRLFENSDISPEEINDAAWFFSSSELLLKEWRDDLNERKERLERYSGFLEGICRELFSTQRERYAILEKNLDELGIHQRFLDDFVQQMRERLGTVRTELENDLGKLEIGAEQFRNGLCKEIEKFYGAASSKADKLFEQLEGKANQLREDLTRETNDFLGKMRESIKRNTEIREWMGRELKTLLVASAELEKHARQIEELRRAFDKELQKLQRKAQECGKFIRK